jgi:hypothetical protein
MHFFRGAVMEGCDLSDEDFEEIRMLTGFRPVQIRRIRKKFLSYIGTKAGKRSSKQSALGMIDNAAAISPISEAPADGRDIMSISLEEFLAIPTIAVNPLRHQLALCFSFEMPLFGAGDAGEDGLAEVDQPNDGAVKKGTGTGNSMLNQRISFKDFMVALSIFNAPGKKEKKLDFAFKIHDFDRDKKIGKEDLVQYFKLTMADAIANGAEEDNVPTPTNPEGGGEDEGGTVPEEDPESPPEPQDAAVSPGEDAVEEIATFQSSLEKLATSVLKEAKTDSLSFEDFNRVVAPSDFESRLFINLE